MPYRPYVFAMLILHIWLIFTKAYILHLGLVLKLFLTAAMQQMETGETRGTLDLGCRMSLT